MFIFWRLLSCPPRGFVPASKLKTGAEVLCGKPILSLTIYYVAHDNLQVHNRFEHTATVPKQCMRYLSSIQFINQIPNDFLYSILLDNVKKSGQANHKYTLIISNVR